MPVYKSNKPHYPKNNLFDDLYEEFKSFFSKDQLHSLEKCFLKADLDGDRLLNQIELKYWMEKHGKPISQREFRCILQEADLDHDGFINFKEFLTLCLKVGIRKILKEEFPEERDKYGNDFSGIVNYFERKVHSDSEIRSSGSADYRNRLHEIYGSSANCTKLENIFDSEAQSLAGDNSEYTDNEYGDVEMQSEDHNRSYNNSPCCSSESEHSVQCFPETQQTQDHANNCGCCTCNAKNAKVISRRHSAHEEYTNKELARKYMDNNCLPQHPVRDNPEKYSQQQHARSEYPDTQHLNNDAPVNHSIKQNDITKANKNYCLSGTLIEKKYTHISKKNSREIFHQQQEYGNTNPNAHENVHRNSRDQFSREAIGVHNDHKSHIPIREHGEKFTRNEQETNNVHNVSKAHYTPERTRKDKYCLASNNPPQTYGHVANPRQKFIADTMNDFLKENAHHKNSVNNSNDKYCISHIPQRTESPKYGKNPMYQNEHHTKDNGRHTIENFPMHSPPGNTHLCKDHSYGGRNSGGHGNERESRRPEPLRKTSHHDDFIVHHSEKNSKSIKQEFKKHNMRRPATAGMKKNNDYDDSSGFLVENERDNEIITHNHSGSNKNYTDTHDFPTQNTNKTNASGDKWRQQMGNVLKDIKTAGYSDGMREKWEELTFKEMRRRSLEENEKVSHQHERYDKYDHKNDRNENRRSSIENGHGLPRMENGEHNRQDHRKNSKDNQNNHNVQDGHARSVEHRRSTIEDGYGLSGMEDWEQNQKHEIRKHSKDLQLENIQGNQRPNAGHRRSTIEDGHGLSGMEKWDRNKSGEVRKNSKEMGNGSNSPQYSKEHRRSTIEDGHGLSGMEKWDRNQSGEVRKNSKEMRNGSNSSQYSKEHRRSTIEDGHGLSGMEKWDRNKSGEVRKNSKEIHNGSSSPQHPKEHRRSTIEDGHGLSGMEKWDRNKSGEIRTNSKEIGNGSGSPQHPKEHRRSTIEGGHGLSAMEKWDRKKSGEVRKNSKEMQSRSPPHSQQHRRSTIEDGHGLAGMEHWEQNKAGEIRKNSKEIGNGSTNPQHYKEHRRSTIEDGHGLAGMETWDRQKSGEVRKNSKEMQSGSPPHSQQHRRSTIEDGHGLAGMEHWEQNKAGEIRKNSKEIGNSSTSPQNSKEHRRSTIEDGHGLAGMEIWQKNKSDEIHKSSKGTGKINSKHLLHGRNHSEEIKGRKDRKNSLDIPRPENMQNNRRHSAGDHPNETDGVGLSKILPTGTFIWEPNDSEPFNVNSGEMENVISPHHSKEHRRSTIDDGYGLSGMENWDQNNQKEVRKNSRENPHPENVQTNIKHAKEHRHSSIEDGYGLAGIENWGKSNQNEVRKNSKEIPHAEDAQVNQKHNTGHRHSSIEDGYGLTGIENWEQNKQHEIDKHAEEAGNSNRHHSKEHRRSTIEDGHGLAGMESWGKNKSDEIHTHSKEIEKGKSSPRDSNSRKNSKEIPDAENAHINKKHNTEHRRSTIEDGYGLAGIENWEHNKQHEQSKNSEQTGHDNTNHSKEHRRSTTEDGHGLSGMEKWGKNISDQIHTNLKEIEKGKSSPRRNTIEDGYGLSGMEHWDQNKHDENRKNSKDNENVHGLHGNIKLSVDVGDPRSTNEDGSGGIDWEKYF